MAKGKLKFRNVPKKGLKSAGGASNGVSAAEVTEYGKGTGKRIKKEQNRRLRELIDQEKGIKPKTTPEPTKTTPVTSTAQKEVVNSVPEKTPEQIKKEQDAAKKREIQRKVQELINKEKGIQPKIK